MKRDTILIVDDMEINRTILHTLFEKEYNLLEAENGLQAYQLIQHYHHSLAAVLLDMAMPVMDGFEVMKKMMADNLMSRIPVIVITADESIEGEVRAFDLGAMDIIIKPFEPHVVKRRVRNAVELNRHRQHLEEMVEEQAIKLRESRDVIMDTLSSIIEHRSAETGQHVLRIRMFTKVLLKDIAQNCPEYQLNDHSISIIAEAASLHDIGKIAISDSILNKPGRLTKEEFEIMKTHTIKGCDILSGLDRMGDEEYLHYAYNICRYHHERWDGNGYPEGLKGDEIPIYAHAVGIADAYDALTTDRVYKKAIAPHKAITMILNGECGVFSPNLLECLKDVREQFYDLTSKYADGYTPKADKFHEEFDDKGTQLTNTVIRLDQLKYLALLKYTNDTVLEVDLDTGVYHLVFQQNDNFSDLHSAVTLAESYEAFVQHMVHEDDRVYASKILYKDVMKLFEEGLTKQVWKYRVLQGASNVYMTYACTFLRLEIENPAVHRGLFVWHRLESDDQHAVNVETSSLLTQNLMTGILRCRNDKWFSMVYINQGFLAMTGYTREEMQIIYHDHFHEIIHPEDQSVVYQRLIKQQENGNTQQLEYRIITKKKKTLWVLEKAKLIMGQDGQEYLDCVLIDISELRQAQENLRMNMQRYQIIQNQTDDVIFESDIKTGKIEYFNKWEKKFGYAPLQGDALNQLPSSPYIYPSDIPFLRKMVDKMMTGSPYGEIEVRLANGKGHYIWCRIRMTAQFDDENQPVKIVGVIIDIDAEKRYTEELLNKAQLDSLTKLYNKNTASELIQQRLRERKDENYAMMMIDLDNFKIINDSYGHMFGDAILTETAKRIKKIFSYGDIVSRFGGDEFMIFLTYEHPKQITNKAVRIIESLANVRANELQTTQLTCSIGIACCPKDGMDFQSLFRCCDIALYDAKKQGKHCFSCYAEEMVWTFGQGKKQELSIRTEIESSQNTADYSIDSFVPEAFDILYKSENTNSAINRIMEMIGLRYHVSRVYIFENTSDEIHISNTFEWCGKGILSEKENLQNIAFTKLGTNYADNFDENGIFYCEDISQLPKPQYELLAAQNIRSLLQCAIYDQGKFIGFVGFDDCLIYRLWTQGQINALTFIAEFLSVFLLKQRAQDRALRFGEDMRMLLDNQNSWIYVIDPDTYQVIYINAKTKLTVPETSLGQCCYKAFFNRDTPCESCPARNIRKNTNKTMEIYNPNLHIWSSADASLIHWGEQDACLLTCHDISAYKKR